MQPSPEQEIQELEARFEARRDRDGRGFVPLAEAHRRAGSLERALELVEEGLERYPDLIAGQLVAGRVFREHGDLGRARDAYARVLELHGEHPEALAALAEISEEEDREAEAREFYHRWALAEPEEDRPREALRRLKRRHFQQAPPTGEADAPAPSGPPEEAETSAPGEEPGPAAPPEEPVRAVEAPDEPAEAGAPSEPFPEPADETAPPAAEDEAAVPEPVPPEPEADGDDAPAVYTRTMGELYARQGLTERAVDVYRKLVERDPDDPELRERLEALEARGPTATAPPDADARAVPGARTEEEMEDLAREWAAGPDETGSLDSPFAWGEEEEPAAAPREEEAPGLTAAAYFERLLEDAEAEEPRAEAVGEPEDEAPDEARDEADDEREDDFRRWLDGLGP